MLRECATHGNTEYRTTVAGYLRCRKCAADAVRRRRLKVKQLLIQELGGGCSLCGYDKYLGALEFHHKNPADKSFALSGGGLTRSIARMRQEALKCILLCANCHREVEAGIVAL